jgi:membrane protein DedA with SNARE-associated domain
MLPFPPLPETQASLALSIVLFSFAYEDGATLLAAALAAAGRIDARLGLFSAFLGIWIGDLGLYGMGSIFGRRLLRSRWAHRLLPPEKLGKAETWFRGRGAVTLVISRFVPGSRLPLYLAAGTLGFSAQSFAWITGVCSALWVSVIFLVWHFVPRPAFGAGSAAPWLLAVAVLFGPWLLSRSTVRIAERVRTFLRSYSRREFWPLSSGRPRHRLRACAP